MVDVPLLSARSVVLSVLLGAHPARLTAAQLVATGEHVGVPAATLRVALTRAVASGDLERDGGAYALAERHLARRRRQDEAVEDAERSWDGDWETVVVVGPGRPGPARAALREELHGLRLAELREGVWMRPANLTRPGPPAVPGLLETFLARPDVPERLAAGLWDLPGWAARGEELAAYV
ncbi:MAG TPA: PaaX domain-containing protein, C- domain protein, partial [Nocardioides sp.]